jgi:enoyl-CoA hydratase
MEIVLTGEPLSAARAHEFGLVNRLTEPGDALAGARQLAATVAANGPMAVRATKQVLSMAIGYTDADLITEQRRHIDPVFASQDAQEGALAFAEKRAPRWTGK